MPCRAVDQQFGIDRRTAGMAVEIRKVGADAAQIDKTVDGSKQVIHGDVILKRELVEKCCLRFLSRSQHCSILPPVRGIESATYASIKHEFFNKISRQLQIWPSFRYYFLRNKRCKRGSEAGTRIALSIERYDVFHDPIVVAVGKKVFRASHSDALGIVEQVGAFPRYAGTNDAQHRS